MIKDKTYKYDSKGKLRVWFMEIDGSRYRTIAGIDGGSLVESEWTQAEPTNVGRSNERSAEEQAEFEVAAGYKHKLTREYHTTPEAAKGGAHYYKPMLAAKYEPKKTDWSKPMFMQPKLDGMRCVMTAEGMFSRQGKPITSCPHIIQGLAPAFEAEPDLVLDGELYNHDYRDRFGELMSALKKANPDEERQAEIVEIAQYHIYDVPSNTGDFSQRKDWLDDFFIGSETSAPYECGSAIQFVPTYTLQSAKHFDDCHAQAIQLGYEGSMLRLDAPYKQSRSKSLQKRKDFDDAEFDLVRLDEGTGNWAGAAKKAWCWLPGADRSNGPDFEKETNIFGAGIRGSYDRGVELLQEDHSVVTVRYFGYTDTDIPKPRFGVVTQFHDHERTT